MSTLYRIGPGDLSYGQAHLQPPSSSQQQRPVMRASSSHNDGTGQVSYPSTSSSIFSQDSFSSSTDETGGGGGGGGVADDYLTANYLRGGGAGKEEPSTRFIDLTTLPPHLYTPAPSAGAGIYGTGAGGGSTMSHPLGEAVLYITGLDRRLTDTEIARGFASCLPVRIRMSRDAAEGAATDVVLGGGLTDGVVEFQSLDSAHRAYATLQDHVYPDSARSVLKLRYTPPQDHVEHETKEAEAHFSHVLLNFSSLSGQPRSKDEAYDLFHRFGPIARIHWNQGIDTTTGMGFTSGQVAFFDSADAIEAERVLVDVIRNSTTINVPACPPIPDYYATALARGYPVSMGNIMPSASAATYGARPYYNTAVAGMYPGAVQGHHHGGHLLENFSGLPASHHHPSHVSANGHHGYPSSYLPLGPGGALLQSQGSSMAGLPERGIDPRNLFVKNLDPSISSNDLFQQFRPYGRIVSARVMRDEETGHSRGFGFVSYQQPREAAMALAAMNGYVLGGKSLVVRLHEPKTGKVGRKPGSAGHPQSMAMGHFAHYPGASSAHSGEPVSLQAPSSSQVRPGAVSMAERVQQRASSGRDGSLAGLAASPEAHDAELTEPPVSASEKSAPKLVRRTSNSYFRAAVSAGPLDSTSSMADLDYDDLQAMSPKMRKEVLSGQVMKAILDLDLVKTGGPSFAWMADDAEKHGIVRLVEALLQMRLNQLVEALKMEDVLREKVAEANDQLGPGGEDGRTLSSDVVKSSSDSLVTSFSALQTGSTTRTSSDSRPAASQPAKASALLARSEHDRLEQAVRTTWQGPPTDLPQIVEMMASLGKGDRAKCLFNPEFLQEKLAFASEIVKAQRGEEAPGAQGAGGAIESESAAPASAHAVSPTHRVSEPQLKLTEQHVAALTAQEAMTVLLQAQCQLSTPQPAEAEVQSLQLWIDELEELEGDGTARISLRQRKQLIGERLFKLIKTFSLSHPQKTTIALLDSEELRSLALLLLFPSILRIKCALLEPAL